MDLSTMDLLYQGGYYGANYVTHTHTLYQGRNLLYRVWMHGKTVEHILTDSLDKEDLKHIYKMRQKSDCF